jgi:hypothetical protein
MSTKHYVLGQMPHSRQAKKNFIPHSPAARGGEGILFPKLEAMGQNDQPCVILLE